jgi:putative oxidoreductase
VAILTIHGRNGPWVTDQGYEYNAVLIASSFVIAANPGSWALDGALGLDEIHGTAFAIGALVLGVLGGMLALTVGRSGKSVAAPPTPTAQAGARFEHDGDGGVVTTPDNPGIPADPR